MVEAVTLAGPRAAAGGLLRNDCRAWLVGFSRFIVTCSVLEAKLGDNADGLRILWARGYRRVVVECDNLEVVNRLHGQIGEEVEASLFRVVAELCNRNWDVRVTHTYKRATRGGRYWDKVSGPNKIFRGGR